MENAEQLPAESVLEIIADLHQIIEKVRTLKDPICGPDDSESALLVIADLEQAVMRLDSMASASGEESEESAPEESA